MRALVRLYPGTPEEVARALHEALVDANHKHWPTALNAYLDRRDGPVKTAFEMSQATRDSTVIISQGCATPPELPTTNSGEPGERE